MCPRSQPQKGFGIIAAIVILVILASLGGFLVNLSTSQSAGSVLDVQGARAKAAAESGVEWGLYHSLRGGATSCSGGGTTTDIGTVGDMSVSVTCTTVATGNAVEAGLGAIYLISAIACNLPSGSACPGRVSSPNYVERGVVALVER